MVARGNLDSAPATLEGTVLLSKWRLLRPIARGGTSTVYEAVHRNGRRAAVKVLHPTLAADKTGRARFLRESLLVNRVNNASVVPVIDDDIAPDGTVFLVMDLLQGETLDQRWKRAGRKLEVDVTLGILEGILDGLTAVHRVGIVHRDLKPSNVFLSSEGLKLLDFGIACLREKADDEGTLTQTGSVLGTPAFMAPEQARGHWDIVDARTDVWAVGAIGFSLLAGRFVHEGTTPHELLIATATQTPLSLAVAAPQVPTAVVELIDKALQLDPAQRWPDAAAMLAGLRRARHSSGLNNNAALQLVCSTVASSSIDVAVATVTTLEDQAVPSRSSVPLRIAPGVSVRAAAAWALIGAALGLIPLAARKSMPVSIPIPVDVNPRPLPAEFVAISSVHQELQPHSAPPSARPNSTDESSRAAIWGDRSKTIVITAPAHSNRLPENRAVPRREPSLLSAMPARTVTPPAAAPITDAQANAKQPRKTGQVFSGVVVDDDELDHRR